MTLCPMCLDKAVNHTWVSCQELPNLLAGPRLPNLGKYVNPQYGLTFMDSAYPRVGNAEPGLAKPRSPTTILRQNQGT